MDLKKATTLASIIMMTFMLSGGLFLQVRLTMEFLAMKLKALSCQRMRKYILR